MKSNPTPDPSALPLSPTKRRLFLGITLLVPVLVIAALELSLRLAHYGPDLSLLRSRVVGHRTLYSMNPDVKSRYFSRIPFTPNTSPDLFALPKPPGTYRIFCLGGSTTVGYPYWFNGAFASFLRQRLNEIFPDRKIEVVNMGMTATNSFTTLDVARDLIDCQPDLFVVYDGHNEFYGALGAASNESPVGSRLIVEVYFRLLHWKTFLLLRGAYNYLASMVSPPSPADNRITMMEKLARGHVIPLGSPTYRSALSAFEGNLRDLRTLCESRGIALILSTQVSNLRDQPPFVSGEAPGKTSEDRQTFIQKFTLGMRLRAEGNVDSALHTFRELLAEDSLRADTHFQIARCLDTLGRRHEAGEEYVASRDLDQLRFRTSTDFNNVIRNMADGRGTSVVDLEDTFRLHSPDLLIGNDFIVEHLHPNSRGSFLMAKSIAEAMRAEQLLSDEDGWRIHDTVPDSRLWDRRPVTPIDELMAGRAREILTSGWPFTDHVPIVRAIPESDTLGQIAENLTRGFWTWAKAHEAAASYYDARGDRKGEEEELRALLWMQPLEPGTYLQLARLYLKVGRPSEVRSTLLSSLAAEPTAAAYRLLADISLQGGNPVEAISWFTKATSLPMTVADRANTSFGLALACLRANMPGDCVRHLQEVLSLDPGHARAKELLDLLQHGTRQPPRSPHQ